MTAMINAKLHLAALYSHWYPRITDNDKLHASAPRYFRFPSSNGHVIHTRGMTLQNVCFDPEGKDIIVSEQTVVSIGML